MSPAPVIAERIGAIVTSTQVAVALRNMLRDFFVAYLAEVERQEGLDPRTLPVPRHYGIGADIDEDRPEHQKPSVWVLIPSLDGEPARRARGLYGASFVVAVGAIVVHNQGEPTRVLAGRYEGAVRACMVREAPRALKAAFGGEPSLDWADASYDEGDVGKRRTLGVIACGFTVTLEGVVKAGVSPFPDGPPTDPYEPPPDYGVADTVDVTIKKEPLA